MALVKSYAPLTDDDRGLLRDACLMAMVTCKKRMATHEEKGEWEKMRQESARYFRFEDMANTIVRAYFGK